MRIVIFIISLLFFTSLSAQEQRGKASYYSKRATGARTSSGEKLHHDSMTCAHRTHPFGTMLRVTCPATGKTVVVRVTDRGPFSHGRIIDLSWGAAKALGILDMGIATVHVEVIRQGQKLGPLKSDESLEIPEIDFIVPATSFCLSCSNTRSTTITRYQRRKSLNQRQSPNIRRRTARKRKHYIQTVQIFGQTFSI